MCLHNKHTYSALFMIFFFHLFKQITKMRLLPHLSWLSLVITGASAVQHFKELNSLTDLELLGTVKGNCFPESYGLLVTFIAQPRPVDDGHVC